MFKRFRPCFQWHRILITSNFHRIFVFPMQNFHRILKFDVIRWKFDEKNSMWWSVSNDIEFSSHRIFIEFSIDRLKSIFHRIFIEFLSEMTDFGWFLYWVIVFLLLMINLLNCSYENKFLHWLFVWFGIYYGYRSQMSLV